MVMIHDDRILSKWEEKKIKKQIDISNIEFSS